MAFGSDKERRGFFARIKDFKQDFNKNTIRRIQEKRVQEQQELDKLRSELRAKQVEEGAKLKSQKELLETRLENERLLKQQREELKAVQDEEARTKAELRKFTATGKASAFIKKEAKLLGHGAAVVGKGIKTAATSDTAKQIGRGFKRDATSVGKFIAKKIKEADRPPRRSTPKRKARRVTHRVTRRVSRPRGNERLFG